MAPIHCFSEGTPLRVCLFTRSEPDAGPDPFVLLRELPGSRVYLGAVCDAAARLQEWVEIWVQTLDLREVVFSDSQERLANYAFDQRWRSDHQRCLGNLPETVIVTGTIQAAIDVTAPANFSMATCWSLIGVPHLKIIIPI